MIEFAAAVEPSLRRALREDVVDATLDPRGIVVRCTPWRVTSMLRVAVDGQEMLLFRKARRHGVAAAEAEWRWLRVLPELGLRVSPPVCYARAGERTAVITRAAVGRPLPLLLAAAGGEAAIGYAADVVIPMVRRLHAARLVFRDLYWQHLFAGSLSGGEEPVAIDVERVLHPVLRWRRWVVKDLAGLVASWPLAGSAEAAGREMVRAYRGRDDPTLLRRVRAKAARIRAHRPRFG
jgi:hypothetical protein